MLLRVARQYGGADADAGLSRIRGELAEEEPDGLGGGIEGVMPRDDLPHVFCNHLGGPEREFARSMGRAENFCVCNRAGLLCAKT